MKNFSVAATGPNIIDSMQRFRWTGDALEYPSRKFLFIVALSSIGLSFGITTFQA